MNRATLLIAPGVLRDMLRLPPDCLAADACEPIRLELEHPTIPEGAEIVVAIFEKRAEDMHARFSHFEAVEPIGKEGLRF